MFIVNTSTSAATSPSVKTANSKSLAVGASLELGVRLREKVPLSAGQAEERVVEKERQRKKIMSVL